MLPLTTSFVQVLNTKMSDFNALVDKIELRVDDLTNRCDQMKEEKSSLLRQTSDLNAVIEENNKAMERLKHENEMLKMAGSLVGEGNSNSEAKSRINELVREIDKCIALLNR